MDVLNFANGFGCVDFGSAIDESELTRGCGLCARAIGAMATRSVTMAARAERTHEARRRNDVAEVSIVTFREDGTGGRCAGTAVLGTQWAHSRDRRIVLDEPGEVNLSGATRPPASTRNRARPSRRA